MRLVENKEFDKLNKTNLNKMFFDKTSINAFMLTNDYENVIVVKCDFENRKKLVEKIFSEEILKIVEEFGGIIVYNPDGDALLSIVKEEYLKFYKSNSKQEKLYMEVVKEESIITCKIGVRDKNNKISDVKECSGNKKVIIDFINKNNRAYSVKYFHLGYEVVVKLNDNEWITPLELVESGLASRREKYNG